MQRIDKDHEEYWAQTVSYHWQGGMFRLCAYMDVEEGFERALVTDSGVSFYDYTNDVRLGRVEGTVQRSLRYATVTTPLKNGVNRNR